MNTQLIHRCRVLRAGSVALAIAALALTPVAKAIEKLTNPSFETGIDGWTVASGWTLEGAPAGEVNLHRGGFAGELIWQTLDISNVGGVSGTAGMQLVRYSAPSGNTIAVKLYYLDGSGVTQNVPLFNPDNLSVDGYPAGSTYSVNFTLPADAQRITGFSINKTGSGEFHAREFSLDLQLTPPQSPVIGVESDGTALTSGGAPVWIGQGVVGAPAPAPVTFTLKNTGTGPLTLSEVTVEGTNVGDFVVTQPAVSSVLPLESTTFSVTFTPAAAGERLATLKIASNDTPNSPFSINLSGYGMVPMVTLTSPTADATFAGGATIPLEASVESFGASISKVEFYDGETLIGAGQIGLYGGWSYADGSQLSVMASDNGNTMVDYSPPSPEGMYFFNGSFTSQFQLFGTLETSTGSGPGGVNFSFGAGNTLNTSIFGMVLGGYRTLTGGTCGNPKFSQSWSGASAGSHAITARAYYGAGLSVTSAPVGITVEAAATGYAAWALANFSQPERSQGLDDPAADPDGHGVPNLLRYGLGLVPRTPQLAMLPRLVQSSGTPGKRAFEFDIPAPAPAGVGYFFGVSSDLQKWDETALAGLTLECDQTTGDRRLIRVVAPDPAPGQSRLFMTLIVR